MNMLRRLLLLSALLLTCPFAHAQGDSNKAEEDFDRAAALMEKNQFADAAPILELLARDYSSENLFWNLGLAETEIHANDKALQAWLEYRKLAPDDWRGRAKLVQAYQAMGNLKARDAERAELIRLWEKGEDTDLRKQETFCREQIIEANRRVFVLEYFQPGGERMVIYSFQVRAPGAEDYRISLGSYEDTNRISWESGARPRSVRLYHLDLYRTRFHATYRFYEGQPSYETVRESVMSILDGKAKPLSSSQMQ